MRHQRYEGTKRSRYFVAQSRRSSASEKMLNSAGLQSKSSCSAGPDRGGIIPDREPSCESGGNLPGHFGSVKRCVRTEGYGVTTPVCRSHQCLPPMRVHSDLCLLRIRVGNAGSGVTGMTPRPHQPHQSRCVLHFEPAGRQCRTGVGLAAWADPATRAARPGRVD